MRNFFLVLAVLVSHVVALRTTIRTGVHQHRSLLSMAPPNQPNQPQEPGPPKREPNPLVVPTVGLGNNQVIYSFLPSTASQLPTSKTTLFSCIFTTTFSLMSYQGC